MSTTTPQLTPDEIDEILYLTRTNEAQDLQSYLNTLSQTHSCSVAETLDASIDPDNGNTPFHYCAANGFSDLLKTLLTLLPTPNPTLLNLKNAAGNTPLHWASLNGHIAVVKTLTEAGANVWVKNAAGNLPVFEAERAEKDDVVAVLLVAGGKEEEERRVAGGEVLPDADADEVEGQDTEGVEGVTGKLGAAGLD